MSREKSIVRSKKSAVTIADLLAKEGATAIIPGGGLIYDVAKALISHGKNYFSDRTENRMEDFHKALLIGKGSEDDLLKFIKKEFDLDDYYAVLSSCVQDIENEKVAIYSQLLHGLIEKELDSKIRRHFIKSCKELTYSELCFLKDLYINSKHDMMTVGGTRQQVKDMLNVGGPLRRLTIDKLSFSGFLEKDGNSITTMAETFISTIFPSESLSPEALGRKPFSGINVVIVSHQLGEEMHTMVTTEVQEAFWSNQVKSSIHIIDKRRMSNSYLYGAGVLIVDCKPIESQYLEALAEFSKKKPLIRLNIDEQSKCNDIVGIEFAGELTLSSKKRLEVRKEVTEYISSIMV